MDPLRAKALGLSKYLSHLRYLSYPGATRALRNSQPEAQRARCLKQFAIQTHDSGIDKVSTRTDETLTELNHSSYGVSANHGYNK
jgi:hypothetical protein